MSRRTRGPGRWTVAKDVASYLGGWGLIVYETLTPSQNFNLYLLLVGGTLVGIPGMGQLLAMRTGDGRSQPPPEESPPPSPSPSPNGSGAER